MENILSQIATIISGAVRVTTTIGRSVAQHAAVAGRAIGSYACAARRISTYLSLLTFIFGVIVIITVISSQMSHENKMDSYVADLKTHMLYLETLYQARHEEIIDLQVQLSSLTNESPLDQQRAYGGNPLPSDVQALLNNISGTKAATGILANNRRPFKTPFVYQLLPHLMNDRNSLIPAYHMNGGRNFNDVVIGIPTVKRDKESYLMITLSSLINELNDEDFQTTLILVMVGETDLKYVINTARHIENQFPKEVEAGLIEVFSPSASFYPDFENLPITLGDSMDRVKWRTKQNLDTIFLMAYAQSKGIFYLMLEDDVIAKPNYMKDIKQFASIVSITNQEWVYIEYCHIGGIGKLFKSITLFNFITYVQLFYKNMPIDWLLESYLTDMVCSIDKLTKSCQKVKQDIRPKFKMSLFEHIGLYSSLKGKIQKVKIDLRTKKKKKSKPLKK